MPRQLTSDRVGDRCHKLPSQTQLRTQLAGKLLGAVANLGNVPLKLVRQRNVTDVDVQLDDDDDDDIKVI